MNKIPTEEEFANAKVKMKERLRNLDNVRRNVFEFFKDKCNLFKVSILYQKDVNFRVYVFFNTNADLEQSKINGIRDEMIDFTFVEFERQGRGSRNEIIVEFEFDSDENVDRNYNGDYFLRLK